MTNTQQYLDMDLLRFSTAGSVDDGKSTLIGRLLYDSKTLFADQLEAIERSSKARGDEYVNLALLTDGLRAEREQGITIDVAYRYFATPRRKFIMADTPGHVQYTRNMVTGASTANLAIILMDVRKGVLEQTLRHSYIADLLGIRHLVVCINKMDLVDYAQDAFEEAQQAYATQVAAKLSVPDIKYIPISALEGDNVVDASERMPWYEGDTLLQTLEKVEVIHDHNLQDGRFPIQRIIRPMSAQYHDFRGYAGTVAGGVFRKGQEVVALPSGLRTRIKTLETFGTEHEVAFPPMAIVMTLEDELDISRGDMIVAADNLPEAVQTFTAKVCWLNAKPLQVGGKYLLRHTTQEVQCVVKEVRHQIDIHTLEQVAATGLGPNDIGEVVVQTARPLFIDPYTRNRTTGSLILVDAFSNETVAGGMIV